MRQLSLSLSLRERAIKAIYLGKDAEWVRLMQIIAEMMFERGEEFTSDNLWKEMERREVPGPSEPRAMGAVMARLRHLNLAVPTNRTQASERESNHARPVRIWVWRGRDD